VIPFSELVSGSVIDSTSSCEKARENQYTLTAPAAFVIVLTQTSSSQSCCVCQPPASESLDVIPGGVTTT